MSVRGAADGTAQQSYQLSVECELRFGVQEGHSVQLKLERGSAEIAGIELAPHGVYTIHGEPGRSVAAFSWRGATLSLTGGADQQDELVYTAEETPMPAVVNAHAVLHAERERGQQGPRVLIVGPTDAGKTLLAETLAAYAVKTSKQIVYVNVDPADGSLAPPGAIGMAVVQHLDLDDTGLVYGTPLCFWSGHSELRRAGSDADTESPAQGILDHAEENQMPSPTPYIASKTLQRSIQALGRKLDETMEAKPELRKVGCIVDSNGWVDTDGYEIVKTTIRALKIDVVIVVGTERLFAQIKRDFGTQKDPQSRPIRVARIPKSGGAINRELVVRNKLRRARLAQYFYGRPSVEVSRPLSPHIITVAFDEVTFLRIVPGPKVPLSALPIGAKQDLLAAAELRVKVVCGGSGDGAINPSDDLNHAFVGVSTVKDPTEVKEILDTPVIGFVKVNRIDKERRKILLLAPSPGRLPGSLLLLGSLRWME